MPPITITLTESEATHVRELIEVDKEGSTRAISLFPDGKWYHEVMVELDEGILKKFKDA